MTKVVLQHHNQGSEAIGDYVINVLPTNNTTTTTTTLETIKTILETADITSSLERILSKIVAEICPKHSRVCENLNLGEKGNLGGEMIEETDSLEKLSLEDEIMSLKKIKPPKMEVALQHCEIVPNRIKDIHLIPG